MSWFFWLMVLPFLLNLVVLPKCSAANVGDHNPNYHNKVKVKNVLLAIIVGCIPIVNFFSIGLCIYMIISNYQEAFSSKFLDSNFTDIFKRG